MASGNWTLSTQRIAILMAGLVGLACCVLAVLDARSQQLEDLAVLPPTRANEATLQAAHHMRGWPSHEGATPTPAHTLVGKGPVLG